MTAPELKKTLANGQGDPFGGWPWKQPSSFRAPVEGSRAKATTAPEKLEVTYTVRPSGLTATPSAPSSPGALAQTPEAPSRPSVPSELQQLSSETAPVEGSRLRTASEP